MPMSWSAIHGVALLQFTVYLVFASNSRLMRLLQAPFNVYDVFFMGYTALRFLSCRAYITSTKTVRETFSRLFGFWPRDPLSKVHGTSTFDIVGLPIPWGRNRKKQRSSSQFRGWPLEHTKSFRNYRATWGMWGSPKPIHLKPGHLKNLNGISQHTVQSRRRFPCLDGAFRAELP